MSKGQATVSIGFIPLLDCAPVVAARELGFAAAEGIDIELHRETSWATLRDRLAVGHLDAAHMLAPMPIAANLGLTPLPCGLAVPMSLSSGGNTITVSRALWQDLAALGAPRSFDARGMLDALAALIRRRKQSSAPRLAFGIVHAFSAHHYELAYWLAAGGILPGADIDLVVLPPSLMPAALASGRLDGFCAGEPWGTVAVAEDAGQILLTNAHIWKNSPEKVLAVRSDWMQADADRCHRLVRAIYRAAVWCDAAANRDALAEILSRPAYVGQPVERIAVGLSRAVPAPGGERVPVEGFLSFAANAQTFPWVSHALWFYAQMVRWGQVAIDPEAIDRARATYRPDIYRAALAPLGVVMPSANSKLEGALRQEQPVGSSPGGLSLGPDDFFDGRIFDPDDISGYLRTTDRSV